MRNCYRSSWMRCEGILHWANAGGYRRAATTEETADESRQRGWCHTGGANQILPIESVKNTITGVLSILGNEALKQPDRFEERR